MCETDPACNVELRAQAEEVVREMRIVYPVMDMDVDMIRKNAEPDDILLTTRDTAATLGANLPGRLIVIDDATRRDEVKGKLLEALAGAAQG